MGEAGTSKQDCLLSCKDTTLKANHNAVHTHMQALEIVFYPAKIQLWKQITTEWLCIFWEPRIVFYPAKIQLWKQITTLQEPRWALRHCLLSCKDTTLKANHNRHATYFFKFFIVFYPAKIQLWKQITTCWSCCHKRMILSFILQRYNFESKSQPKPVIWPSVEDCLLSCKDTTLKANHNARVTHFSSMVIVFYPAKIQLWKQITTLKDSIRFSMYCLLSCKDTTLKANHNSTELSMSNGHIVFYPAKIQLWKQITTW